ncbi:hypothetical protein J2X01_000732 [Arthrobacter ginsengisoli]|uniref:Uncharacterized protein n=1 Tax=Arthrobacter ginsengisoli TaxID=1356565 RepID=A0ABU1U8E4_9MICC|nr:hypothetical protein [Arthrobacter ginsengisoli]MDR7081455.1 hypothetical protein [Arthrobacter ginsengisoli]
MNKHIARAVQVTVQQTFYTIIVLSFFLIPSILEGLLFGPVSA